MALTQDQINALEKLRIDWWAKVTGQGENDVLKLLQANLLALQTISDQIATLTQAMTGNTPATAPVGGVVVNTGIALNLPLTPKEINQFIVSTQDTRGYVELFISQTAFMVPAAGTSGPGVFQFAYPVPPGYVIVSLGPLVVSTTDVGANISVEVSVDGHSVTNSTLGAFLGPGMAINTEQYLVATNSGISATFTNPSASDVTLYFLAETARVARSFYDKFYQPLLDFGYTHIRDSLGLGE